MFELPIRQELKKQFREEEGKRGGGAARCGNACGTCRGGQSDVGRVDAYRACPVYEGVRLRGRVCSHATDRQEQEGQEQEGQQDNEAGGHECKTCFYASNTPPLQMQPRWKQRQPPAPFHVVVTISLGLSDHTFVQSLVITPPVTPPYLLNCCCRQNTPEHLDVCDDA